MSHDCGPSCDISKMRLKPSGAAMVLILEWKPSNIANKVRDPGRSNDFGWVPQSSRGTHKKPNTFSLHGETRSPKCQNDLQVILGTDQNQQKPGPKQMKMFQTLRSKQTCHSILNVSRSATTLVTCWLNLKACARATVTITWICPTGHGETSEAPLASCPMSLPTEP